MLATPARGWRSRGVCPEGADVSQDSPIQWTDKTWNPIRGCSRVSEGCRYCYAESIAARFSGPGMAYEGLARRRSNGEPQWTGEVRVIDSAMDAPLHWRKPARIFVNSMSDLFHENVTDATIDRVFGVMAKAQRHTFQVLTKRPARMRNYCNARLLGLPLPNVWLGVSVEHQAAADERIPLLIETPAAVRFLSCEPLLGPLDLSRYLLAQYREGLHACRGVHWVIVGGESGRHARSCDTRWVSAIVDQCRAADVAPFVKQLGAMAADCDLSMSIGERLPLRDSHGGDWSEWPEGLRVREFPTVAAPVVSAGGTR